MSEEARHIVCPYCMSMNRVPLSKPAREARCGRCHEALFTGHSMAANSASFDVHIQKNDIPVVVDFWAEWCGPCRMIAPALEEIAGSLGEKVKIVKLNVDENPHTAAKYGIQSIPTLMIFKDGQMASRQIGAAPKQKLEQWITTAV